MIVGSLENFKTLIKENSMMLRVESCFCFFISDWCYWIRHKCWQALFLSLSLCEAKRKARCQFRYFFCAEKLFPTPNEILFYIKISFCSQVENWNENIAAICYIKFTSFMTADIDMREETSDCYALGIK